MEGGRLRQLHVHEQAKPGQNLRCWTGRGAWREPAHDGPSNTFSSAGTRSSKLRTTTRPSAPPRRRRLVTVHRSSAPWSAARWPTSRLCGGVGSRGGPASLPAAIAPRGRRVFRAHSRVAAGHTLGHDGGSAFLGRARERVRVMRKAALVLPSGLLPPLSASRHRHRTRTHHHRPHSSLSLSTPTPWR